MAVSPVTGQVGTQRYSCGFTLPELLLVATLIGILSAVSVPVLSGVVSMAYRVHADLMLADAATDLVRNRLDTGTFRLSDSGGRPEGWQDAKADNPFWRFRFRSADRTGFLITAAPDNAAAACPAFGWNQTGRIAGSPVCRRTGPSGSLHVPVTADSHAGPDLP